jgi:hypothetical protein
MRGLLFGRYNDFTERAREMTRIMADAAPRGRNSLSAKENFWSFFTLIAPQYC